MEQSSCPKNYGSRFAKLGMAACCVFMTIPVAAVLLAGGGLSTITGNIGLIAPLALCLGMHFVMHKMMGRACHGSAAADEDLQPVNSVVNAGTDIQPAVRDVQMDARLQS